MPARKYQEETKKIRAKRRARDAKNEITMKEREAGKLMRYYLRA